MTRLSDRPFDHRVSLVCADPSWDDAELASTDPFPEGAAPFAGFVRRADADGTSYAYFAGRTIWSQGAGHVTEGYLFAVSPTLRRAPRHYPSDSREFRALGEAMATDDAALLPELRKAYGR